MKLYRILFYIYKLIKHVPSFFQYISWICRSKPIQVYPGYHCGMCGKWVSTPFSIRDYQSSGEWWDTWGACASCLNYTNKENNNAIT